MSQRIVTLYLPSERTRTLREHPELMPILNEGYKVISVTPLLTPTNLVTLTFVLEKPE